MNYSLDFELNLMVPMFQEAHPIDGLGPETEPSAATKYLTCCAADIERLGRVLKFLGLAEASTDSPLGWKPTADLFRIIARHLVVRAAGPSQKQATAKERKVVESLFQLAGESTEYIEEDFVFRVLNCLGLLRLDGVGDCKPTRLLRETAKAIFDR